MKSLFKQPNKMPLEYLKLIFRNGGRLVGLRHQLSEKTSSSFDLVLHFSLVSSFCDALKNGLKLK